MSERKQGTVKWFNNQKGFGFIQQENGVDIFVHFKSISESNNRDLKENDKVEYSVIEGKKGPQASDVKLISE